MKIDLNKTYQTKAGHDVQIFTTGAPEPYPVVGMWKDSRGDWVPDKWTREGRSPVAGVDSVYDLEEVKPKRLVYVNLYPPEKASRMGEYVYWDTEDKAKEAAMPCAIAVAVPVYIEEEE